MAVKKSLKHEITTRVVDSKFEGVVSAETIVPDTSVIIEGLISEKLLNNSLKTSKIIIHEAVIAELEAQANKGRETGFLGLEEISNIKKACQDLGIALEFKGSRPGDFEIRHARSGEIDNLIRQLALEENAWLVTADKVQSLAASVKGCKVLLYEFPEQEFELLIEKFFDAQTMSVHLKEGCKPLAKKGLPGSWVLQELDMPELTLEQMEEFSKNIVEVASKDPESFLEIERRSSVIAQIRDFRIVITKPPFSEAYEITAVKPLKKLSLQDYKLPEKLLERIEKQAEGILIAGSPGHGKTTFAQALAEFYKAKGKIVKTIEAPRDLVLSKGITQYSLSHGSRDEIKDILLLTRPDYTVFDELRNTQDFELFSDLRLSGVGMIGVVHATEPVDAIHRFITRLELGIIPHVVDTVVFIKNGSVSEVLSLEIEVKVPSGMTEADLARPVVSVYDFLTRELKFEIYTYGEETVVVPVKQQRIKPIYNLAKQVVKQFFKKYASNVEVEFVSDDKAIVFVPEKQISKIIGSKGLRISSFEKRLGINIEVQSLESLEKKVVALKQLSFSVKKSSKSLVLVFDENLAGEKVLLFDDDKEIAEIPLSKKASLKLKTGSALWKAVVKALSKHSLKAFKQ